MNERSDDQDLETAENSQNVMSETEKSKKSERPPSSQQDAADQDPTEDDEKLAEAKVGDTISQPIPLMLVQSAQAGTGVITTSATQVSEDDAEGAGEEHHVTGVRLILAIFALILSSTLIFLDNSILSTVRNQPPAFTVASYD